MNSFEIMGRLQSNTVRVLTTNTSQLLTSAIDAALGGQTDWSAISAILITIENNDARIAFGVDASNGVSPVGHVFPVGSCFRSPSTSLISGARIISETADNAAVLQVTLEC